MIVEDEPLAREILEKYILDTEDLELVSIAEDGKEAFQKMDDSAIDLLFLDINLPNLSGLNLYRSLKEKPPVIFTTAYPDHAVEGFELEAVDYLLKPISYDRFFTAIEKFKKIKALDDTGNVLLVKEDKKMYRLEHSDVLLIESIRDYAKIITKSGVHITSDTLKTLQEKLPGKRFLRVHKSFIVSISAIDYMEGNQLVIGERKIPMGKSYRDDVAKLFRK